MMQLRQGLSKAGHSEQARAELCVAEINKLGSTDLCMWLQSAGTSASRV
jgi:hypothetical protein